MTLCLVKFRLGQLHFLAEGASGLSTSVRVRSSGGHGSLNETKTKNESHANPSLQVTVTIQPKGHPTLGYGIKSAPGRIGGHQSSGPSSLEHACLPNRPSSSPKSPHLKAEISVLGTVTM